MGRWNKNNIEIDKEKRNGNPFKVKKIQRNVSKIRLYRIHTRVSIWCVPWHTMTPAKRRFGIRNYTHAAKISLYPTLVYYRTKRQRRKNKSHTKLVFYLDTMTHSNSRISRKFIYSRVQFALQHRLFRRQRIKHSLGVSIRYYTQ